MRLFLTGAHGTGKTTILNDLKKLNLFKEYKFIDSITSDIVKEKSDFSNHDKLKEIQTKIFARSYDAFTEPKIVSSRSMLDVCSYSLSTYKKTNDNHFKIIADLIESSFDVFKDDIFIYVPIMFNLESKKLRSSDIDFQKEIDSNIKNLLKKSKYNFYEIQSLNNRTQEILDYIDYEKLLS
ncbi:hypothetical protein FI575_08640 [Campylobacter coli]|nr:hypothetical protein [Campylobacter coli]